MRTLCRAVLALGVLALVVHLAPAQQRQRGGGRGFGGLGQLLGTKEVQKELNLSDDQVEKAKKVADDVQKKHQEEMQKLFQDQDTPREERFAKMQEIQGKVRDETVKELGDVLKPEQTKRLKQLVLQQQAQMGGPGVFLSPDVEKALKLSDKQKEDFKTMQDDYRKQLQEAFQGGFNEESRKKIEEMRKDAMANALKVLDDKQKKEWEEMTGSPFKFPAPMRRGPGGNG